MDYEKLNTVNHQDVPIKPTPFSEAAVRGKATGDDWEDWFT